MGRGFLGHSYLVNSRSVIADIAAVICRGLPPEQRNLTRLDYYGTAYWKLIAHPETLTQPPNR